MINKLSTHFLALAAVLLVLAFEAFAQESAKVSTEAELKDDVSQSPCKNIDRREAAKSLFQKMGAAENDIRIDKFKDIQNIVVTKKGKSEDTVIIGAHYDKVNPGCGTIDNWSGIVILAHLYRSISKIETGKTYMFVAFDREEEGLLGSTAMAKAIPKEERPKYCSMVNLDSFGLGYPLILENASSPAMTKFGKELGKELQMTVNSVVIDGADADSSSFKEKDIPSITISGLTANWQQFLHSPNDKMGNVISGSVKVGYLFSLQYISRIDSGVCSLFKKK